MEHLSYALSDQCASVVHKAIVYPFNVVWIVRSIVIFKDKSVQVSSSINFIVESCSILGHCSRVDFVILKNFKVKIQPLTPLILWS